MPVETVAETESGPQRWVFGYGSLIWKPGFAYAAARPAMLAGAHRSLCIYSHLHRGTPERPGLVFGLMPGGSCRGMAFAVSERDWPEVRDYLREREQATAVYREAMRPVRLADGAGVTALTFLVDPAHDQFAGRLSLADQARMILTAHGASGPNIEYVRNTARHLDELGIRDAQLRALVALLDAPDAPAPG